MNQKTREKFFECLSNMSNAFFKVAGTTNESEITNFIEAKMDAHDLLAGICKDDAPSLFHKADVEDALLAKADGAYQVGSVYAVKTGTKVTVVIRFYDQTIHIAGEFEVDGKIPSTNFVHNSEFP